MSPVDKILEGMPALSREELVAAAHVLLHIAETWPDGPARTFVITVGEAMLAGVDDLTPVIRQAEREYLTTTGRDADPAE